MLRRKKIHIVYTSGREKNTKINEILDQITALGWQVTLDVLDQDPSWPYSAGKVEDRIKNFNKAIHAESSIIWAMRGGYGASGLMRRIQWQEIPKGKLFVGFSDFTSILAGVYCRSDGIGLHASMPGNENFDLLNPNYSQVFRLFDAYVEGKTLIGEMSLIPVGTQEKAKINGVLMGGNFAVLTNLIGTPYFPKNLTNTILMLEDISENPGRLLRFWDHLLLAGILHKVQAVVIGDLQEIGDYEQIAVAEKLAQNSPCPIWKTNQFGHGKQNDPFVVGANAVIEDNKLVWEFKNE